LKRKMEEYEVLKAEIELLKLEAADSWILKTATQKTALIVGNTGKDGSYLA
jgi:hypothetical protein